MSLVVNKRDKRNDQEILGGLIPVLIRGALKKTAKKIRQYLPTLKFELFEFL
jgi:hypothetical protein